MSRLSRSERTSAPVRGEEAGGRLPKDPGGVLLSPASGPRAIREYPDPVLRKRCDPVSPGGPAAETAVAALRAAWAPGIAGLAAPQLGLSVRVIAVMEGDACRIFLNPEILVRSPRVVRGQEACLSLPHVTAEVDRAAEIVFRAFDPERGEVTLGAEGWLAAVVQHEVDHLDGILFIDRLSQAERKLALREAARLRQQLAEKPALILPAA